MTTITLPRAVLEQALGERDRLQAELAARRAALAQEPHRDLRVALQAPGCERLREWVEIGPVQRAALETFVAALAQEQAEPLKEQDVEGAIEAAYWHFDARRSGLSEWASAPQSERDAFKAEARKLARGHFPTRQAQEQAEPTQDLYWRLHNLSKVLEGSGRIDQHDHPDAYATILDAMALAQERAEPIATFDEVWDAIDWDKWRKEPIRELVRMIHSKTSPRAAQGQEPAQESLAWECRAGGLKRLTQRQYDAQPDMIKRHYTRIAPPPSRLTDSEIGEIWFAAKIPGLTETSARILIRAAEERILAATRAEPRGGSGDRAWLADDEEFEGNPSFG